MDEEKKVEKKEIPYDEREPVEKQPEKLPSFMEKIGDKLYIVKTREDGNFYMTDGAWDKIERALHNPAMKNHVNSAIIVTAMVEPKLGELDLKTYNGSTVIRLLRAAQWIYDIESFL